MGFSLGGGVGRGNDGLSRFWYRALCRLEGYGSLLLLQPLLRFD